MKAAPGKGQAQEEKEVLKVSRFQKKIFLFSFEPKNGQNYVLISALASKNWFCYINQRAFNIIGTFFFDLF